MSNPDLQQLERELEAAAVHFSMVDRHSPILSAVDPAQSASVSEARVVSAARDVLERLDREPVDLLLRRSETGPPVEGVDQRQWRAFLGRVRAQLRVPKPSNRLKSAVATTGGVSAARRTPSAFAVAARSRRPGPFGLLVAGTLLIGTLLVIAIRLTTVDGVECEGPDCPGAFAIASGTVESTEPPAGESASPLDPVESERSDSSDGAGARSELGANVAEGAPSEGAASDGAASDGAASDRTDDDLDSADVTTTSSRPGTTVDSALAAAAAGEDIVGVDGERQVPNDPGATSTPVGPERSEAGPAGQDSTPNPTPAAVADRSTPSETTASSQPRATSSTRQATTTTRPSTTRPSTTQRPTTTTRPTTTARPSTTTTTRPTTTQPPVTERLAPIESEQAGVACPGGSTASRDVYRVADNDVLNVRLGPGTGFEIVYGLPPNATGVQVFEGSTSGSWIMVLIPGRSVDDPAGQSCGWSHGGFLTVPD